MIPKMAMMDLDPYELVLYCHYKMTASEHGKCWKSNKTLANETGMSERKLQESRTSLAAKGFIVVSHAPDENGNINTPPTIKIVSVWADNRNRYGKKESDPLAPHATPLALSATPLAPHATKESVLNKNSKSKDTSADAPLSIQFPKSVKSYTIEHIHFYQRLYDAELKALIAAWSDVVMFPTIASFSLKEARAYIEVHKELARLNKPCGDYLALANHTKKKNVWKTEKGSKLWITDMLDYVTEYKPVPKVEQSTKPMTEAEYDLLLIKEKQEKEAALYGWS